MGNFTSSIPPPSQVGLDHHTAATPDKVGGKRREKRRRHEVVDELTSSDEDNDVPLSPKRQRIQNTSAYIYETFFLKGTGSDVTIKALDGEWKLHKNYLKQSAYFDSMFSGRWLESDLSVIQLDIPDQNITTESLSVAFSSLYKDSVRLETCLIPSVIASATMLQLDGLLNHCLEFIRETINSDVITIYLKTASQYGLNKIKSEYLSWLYKWESDVNYT
jgi:BTB/POZ domain-containing protein 13